MRSWLISSLVGCLMAPTYASAREARPIVVELFTSQGCSSCPPADAIVAELARRHADVLPLTFHVTYWNGLGWNDPFSFPGATDRQKRYVALRTSPAVYTPDLVVEGRRDAIGSDRAAVEREVAAALREVKAEAPVEVSRNGTQLAITVGQGSGHGAVLLVGFDREHETAVGRGENGGRTLREANIVRSLERIGTWSGEILELSTKTSAGEEAAVIIQAEDGRILGAGRVRS